MKAFWNLNLAVFCRFNSIIIQNALFFFLIEEFHATIGLIRKNLEHLVGLLSARQNQSGSTISWILSFVVCLMLISDHILYSRLR